jgi:signal transduction histidine kinase
VIRSSASLKSIVGTAVVALGTVSLLTAAALVVVTSDLSHATTELRSGVESVRLAEEAALHLLLHARDEDRVTRTVLERDLRERLAGAAAYVTSQDEARILDEASALADAYLAGADGPRAQELLQDAFRAVERLVAINVQQAEAAEGRALRWDRMSNAIGLGASALLVGSVAWLLFWLRAAFQPAVAIAHAMKRFGEGDPAVRAPESGPAELREISSRFNEMAVALAALRQRQRAFVAALAHELRNPLSALKLATSGPAAATPERAGERLALVRRQVLRLERLLSDFLDTARIEAGNLAIRREPVDLRAVVEHVVSLQAATSERHEISAHLPGEEVIASCDGGRIEQVLSNLVANAVKYSPAGGRVSVVLEARGAEVAVSVADEGVGVAADEREAIFEPFRRGLGHERDLPGAGLGLFVSRRIVEAHGGRIHVTARAERGSTFEVVLPR